MVSKTVETFGRLDIMVCNAGIGITKRIVEMSDEEWDEVVDTDLKGVFICGAEAAKVMIEKEIKEGSSTFLPQAAWLEPRISRHTVLPSPAS